MDLVGSGLALEDVVGAGLVLSEDVVGVWSSVVRGSGGVIISVVLHSEITPPPLSLNLTC